MFEKKLQEVVEELTSTKEFSALMQTKRKVEENPELKRRVDKFLEDSERLLRQSSNGPDSRSEEMTKRFTEMVKIAEVAAYFKAGHDFENMVMGLYQSLENQIAKAVGKKGL